MSPSVLADLRKICPGAVFEQQSLAKMSRWRIGGVADAVVRPRSIEQLQALRRYCHEHALPSVVIGSTSNLLFADEGLRALCIHITCDWAPIRFDDHVVTVGPGYWVPWLARQAMLRGLSGLVHTCGIPGTIGGLVYMNGGSQRKGIGEVVSRLLAIGENGDIREYTHDECNFTYRHSVFHNSPDVIAEVELTLEPGHSPQKLRREMLAIMRDRRAKFPQKIPNCGSVFKSNPNMYAEYGPPGKILEALGFKGRRVGGAVVPQRHANFIVNDESAKASDVVRLVREMHLVTCEKTGHAMEAEVKLVSSIGKIEAIV